MQMTKASNQNQTGSTMPSHKCPDCKMSIKHIHGLWRESPLMCWCKDRVWTKEEMEKEERWGG